MSMSSVAILSPEEDARGQKTPESSPAARRKRKVSPRILLIPAIAILLFGLGYPVLWQLFISFQDWGRAQLFGQPAEWIWLDNYIRIFTDSTIWNIVVRSVLFCVITSAVTVFIAGLLALLMKAVGPVVRLILQLSLLLAWAMPVVAAMTVWIWLFDRRSGVVNYLLMSLGFEEFYLFSWLEDPSTFFALAAVIVIWMSVPFVALALYAGLTQVSDEVLEAAEIDGASGWKRTRYIIFPMIRPVLNIVVLLQLIWNLRVFTQIKMLQDRGSGTSDYDLLGTFIYKTGVQSFGLTAALSIFVLGLTIGLTFFYVRSMLKEETL